MAIAPWQALRAIAQATAPKGHRPGISCRDTGSSRLKVAKSIHQHAFWLSKQDLRSQTGTLFPDGWAVLATLFVCSWLFIEG
jgi:hypothetical protein